MIIYYVQQEMLQYSCKDTMNTGQFKSVMFPVDHTGTEPLPTDPWSPRMAHQRGQHPSSCPADQSRSLHGQLSQLRDIGRAQKGAPWSLRPGGAEWRLGRLCPGSHSHGRQQGSTAFQGLLLVFIHLLSVCWPLNRGQTQF